MAIPAVALKDALMFAIAIHGGAGTMRAAEISADGPASTRWLNAALRRVHGIGSEAGSSLPPSPRR